MTLPHLLQVNRTFSEWLFSACVFLLVISFVLAVKRFYIRKLKKTQRVESQRFAGAVLEALRAVNVVLVGLAALYPSIIFLGLDDTLLDFAERISSAALVVQIGVSASVFISKALEKITVTVGEGGIYPIKHGVSALVVFAKVAIWGMIFIMLLENLNVSVTPLLAGLGIGSIALGLALQHVLSDIFASLSIVLDKPFEVGHFIEVDAYAGRVENIGMKTTRIRSASGEMIVMGNADLTKSRIKNYKLLQERRAKLVLNVHPLTPLDKLESIPVVVAQCFSGAGARFDGVYFRELSDFSLVFEVGYFVRKQEHDAHAAFVDTQHRINMQLLRAFAENRIELAFARKADFSV